MHIYDNVVGNKYLIKRRINHRTILYVFMIKDPVPYKFYKKETED